MRVNAVWLDAVEVPFREPIRTGARGWEARGAGVLALGTEEGATGLGEIAIGPGEHIEGIAPALSGVLVGLQLDDLPAVESALESVDAWPTMGRPVRSAVESALIEVVATSRGQSVGAFLARSPRTTVLVNATIGIAPPEAAAAHASSLVADGYRCLKLKAGAEAGVELSARVGAVRAAVGPEIALRLDFNGALLPEEAEAILAAVAGFELEYAEQPLATEAGAEALARLRWTGDVPIAADESVTDPEAARVLLDTGAVDALVVKPARVGGLRQARHIVDLAEAAGVPVTISTLFETGVGLAGALHLAAAVPGTHGLATADLLESDLLLEPLAVRDGLMAVPVGPGLGVRLDPDAVVRYRVA